ncbi:MAG: hypothetical protein CGW95_04135 [Phenylobacterium zucineum]|nr:MAG: hypothetical protein CGW95_04135 [Phenylobacterium zucineum]
MYNDPKDLARSALAILALANEKGTDQDIIIALELAAVNMANHVWDWHRLKYNLSKREKISFAKIFPAWNILREISNGIKHAKPIISDPNNTELREVEWEDDDFWAADHGRKILFIMLNGEQRSVSAIVKNFATEYLRYIF